MASSTLIEASVASPQAGTPINRKRSPIAREVPSTGGRTGVHVVSGYGIRIAVERGQLIVSDGIGSKRREARYSRATCGIKRLVVLGHSGTISFEALRWLADIGG